jgi:hypothetical protein
MRSEVSNEEQNILASVRWNDRYKSRKQGRQERTRATRRAGRKGQERRGQQYPILSSFSVPGRSSAAAAGETERPLRSTS